MSRFPLLLLSSLLITSNAYAETTAFRGPSGSNVYTTKCKGSNAECYEEASRYCKGGSYQIVSSERHEGGLICDCLGSGGPVMYYSMSYVCGKSDGRMASFAFHGNHWEPPRPTYVNCDLYPNNVQCYGYR
jgi:hypothetical protein